MKNIEVISRVLGQVSTNAYIAYHKESKKAVLIDPAASPQELIAEIEEHELHPEAILLTHGHFDHILAVDAIRSRYQIKVYLLEHEKDLIADPVLNGSRMFVGNDFTTHADVLVSEGDELKFADTTFKVLHTPGHTYGSCCFYSEEEQLLFSGDTLFFRTYGRTDLPTGSEQDMCHSILDKLFVLPDEVIAYPGHDRSTTIGYERTRNEVLLLKRQLGIS